MRRRAGDGQAPLAPPGHRLAGADPLRSKGHAQWLLGQCSSQVSGGSGSSADDVAREGQAAIPGTSISGRRVGRQLSPLVARRDRLGMILSDDVTEVTSAAIPAWAADQRVGWHRARQAHSERRRGELQWPVVRRVLN